MTFRFFIFALTITGCFLFNRNGFCNAGEPAIISLWPGTAPGETAELPPEGEFTEGGTRVWNASRRRNARNRLDESSHAMVE